MRRCKHAAKAKTKLEAATDALLEVAREEGWEFVRTQFSGSLQQAMSPHLKGPYSIGEISEGTINLARRRLLLKHGKGAFKP